MRGPLWVLRIDSAAGFTAGLLSAAFHMQIAALHGWRPELVLFFSAANALYGLYSGTLAVLAGLGRRVWKAVRVLALMNALWAVHCLLQILLLSDISSWTGMAHLGFEAVFVALLAWIEVQYVVPALQQS